MSMIKARHRAVAALGAAMVLSAATGALAADASKGRRVAERWCSDCHAVAGEQVAGRTAPSFKEIAGRSLLTESYLDSWTRNPTAPMHKFQLSPAMIADLVAYLRSLRE
ncbi:MAG: cytochrome c [Alphaproteobacteria bacterium]|nr:cytochrome c [Alphaproteobacteria bacterium]